MPRAFGRRRVGTPHPVPLTFTCYREGRYFRDASTAASTAASTTTCTAVISRLPRKDRVYRPGVSQAPMPGTKVPSRKSRPYGLETGIDRTRGGIELLDNTNQSKEINVTAEASFVSDPKDCRGWPSLGRRLGSSKTWKFGLFSFPSLSLFPSFPPSLFRSLSRQIICIFSAILFPTRTRHQMVSSPSSTCAW